MISNSSDSRPVISFYVQLENNTFLSFADLKMAIEVRLLIILLVITTYYNVTFLQQGVDFLQVAGYISDEIGIFFVV